MFDDEKPALWKKQGGITSDGVEIPAGQVFNANLFVGDHSDLPHSKGGQTTIENGKMETVVTVGEKELSVSELIARL